MSSYQLDIVSMDGPAFSGNVEKLLLRTIDGDVEILARHTNFCTAIGMGTAHVVLEDGTERRAACIGGMLSVMNGICRVLPTTWEWSDEIDLERAKAAKEKAEKALQDAKLDEEARVRAQAKLYRALVRIGSASLDEGLR
ncbi:MAG: ATP synthase F1 subunit epsilon [Lachnospiraceae bacterium]|nr:ATP synthase F1 subunit epsilon [Lachnospiraceae bacterium]